MTPTWRKPFGILLMLLLIAAWTVSTITIMELVPQLDHPITYVVTGIVWIWLLPMKALMRWMETGKWRE